MAMSAQMKQVLGVFVLIVLALALTPSVGSFATDATYTDYTDYKLITAGTSNATTTTYTARNDSSTYAYFTVVIVAGGTGTTSEFSSATIDYTNFTYTVATKTLIFDGTAEGPFDETKTYNMSITYYTQDNTNDVALVLLPIVPILWVTAVMAVGIVMVTVLLKRHS